MSESAGEDRAGDRGEEARPTVPGLSVGRLLGVGGSSTVWLVEAPDGQRFALKVLNHDQEDAGRPPPHTVPAGPRHGRRAATTGGSLAGGAPVARTGHDGGDPLLPGPAGTSVIADELRLLHRFTHDHLLRVHRVIPTDLGPGLLMELAPGGSLLGLLSSRGPLPLPEVVTTLVPIAQALGYLHADGVMHGDVTPGNILFTSDGRPLLGDFGTGRLLGSDRQGRGGTPGFIDPTHHGSFDPGADVFALSAVAWFALTGRIPGPTEERPPLALINPEVPVHLMQLIEDGLSSRRERRPSADDVARTLLRSATPSPVDLVPAVHTSVLPELLTSRVEPSASAPGLRERMREARGSGARSGPMGRRRISSTSVRESRGGRPGPSRSFLALFAAAVAVLLLTLGLAYSIGGGGGEEEATGPGAVDRSPAQASAGPVTPVDVTSDPLTALSALVALRAEAFTAADPGLLAGVDVEGSPALTADTAAVEALAGAGRTLADLSITVRDAVVLPDADRASIPALEAVRAAEARPATEVCLVRATAALSSYTSVPSRPDEALPREGTGVDPVMAAGHQELIFILWDSGEGWRIHSVITPPQ